MRARPEGEKTAPSYTVLSLCRNRAGFEAAPRRALRLDLSDVEVRLRSGGAQVLGNAGVLLAIRIAGAEASVFESGKVLIKTKDEGAATRALAEFRTLMGWGPEA
ncbi:MAG: hypothetical protein ACYDDF_14220 [Thermoplasmatota archaeon]